MSAMHGLDFRNCFRNNMQVVFTQEAVISCKQSAESTSIPLRVDSSTTGSGASRTAHAFGPLWGLEERAFESAINIRQASRSFTCRLCIKTISASSRRPKAVNHCPEISIVFTVL